MGNKVKIENISARGLTFKCRTCGLENKGELVVLLHGFPESSIIWEGTLERLADLGYRCIAPDQRGYSAGARPAGIGNYTYYNLATDVVAFADAVGNPGKFHLVGHDWGSAAGWATVAFYPERIQSWTGMATPHSKAFRWAMENDPVQHAKSHYIFEFMTPDAPEASLAADDYARLRGYWAGFDQKIIDDYLTIFSVPEARTATINYYRAALMPPSETNPAVPLGDVYTPTLFIWGMTDLAIAKAGVDLGHQYMKGDYKYVQLNAGHWLMQFNEEECIKEIIEHVQKFPIK